MKGIQHLDTSAGAGKGAMSWKLELWELRRDVTMGTECSAITSRRNKSFLLSNHPSSTSSSYQASPALTSSVRAMVMRMAHPAIPASPMRCRVLRPARSTTNSCGMDMIHQHLPSLQEGPPSPTFPGRTLGGPKLTETTVKAVFTTPEPMVA